MNAAVEKMRVEGSMSDWSDGDSDDDEEYDSDGNIYIFFAKFRLIPCPI